MVGTVPQAQSQFSKVVQAWENHMAQNPEISKADFTQASAIASVMNAYLEAKDLRAQNDSAADAFFKELASADLKVISAIYSEAKDAETATGDQLAFWAKSEALINKFRSPKWVDTNGEIVATSGILSARNSGYDTKGNKLTNHHMIASAILQDEAVLFSAFSAKRVLANNDDVGIPVEVPPQASVYLHLFENARLANNMSEEDQLMSRKVEKMVLDWMLKKHAPAPLLVVGGAALAKGAVGKGVGTAVVKGVGGSILKKGLVKAGKNLVKDEVKGYVIDKGVGALKNGASKAGGKAKDAAKKVGSKIKGLFRHLFLKKVGNSVKNGGKKAVGFVKDQYGDTIKKTGEDLAKKALDKAKEEAERKGKEMINGKGGKGGKGGRGGRAGRGGKIRMI